jgi:hypothetical protein
MTQNNPLIVASPISSIEPSSLNVSGTSSLQASPMQQSFPNLGSGFISVKKMRAAIENNI